MAGYGFHRDIANDELDIQIAGTVALTLSSSSVVFPVSTVTYGERGTVTQGSGSGHATNVTLNATSGTITLDSTDLAAGAEAQFDVANSFVGIGDVVIVNAATTPDASGTEVVGIAEVNDGSFTILLINPHATTAGFNDATTLNFAIIKTAV